MRGISNEGKRRALFDHHRANSDFLIMQETHSTKECEQMWENEWGGKIIYSHGTSSARGIMMCIKKEVYKNVSNIFTDDEGRLIILDYSEQGVKICIVALYAPNNDDVSFFTLISDKLKARDEHKIMIGDFNLVLDVEMDRENTYNNNNRAMEVVKQTMDQYSLRDIWRVHNPERKEFSWIKGKTYPIKASRIDFALVSGGLDQMAGATYYIPSIKTDHRALYLCLQLEKFERGVGFWKLNTTLLQEINYVNMMNKEIEQTIRSSSHKTPKEVWGILKRRIKLSTKRYAKNKAQKDRLIIGNLSEKVNDYESRLPLAQEENTLYEKTKQDLEDKVMERTQGIMFRSKAKWYEEGEKNTKYFFALEKAKYNAKTCYKILKNGQELMDPKLILQEQRDYYQELYREDPDVNFDLVNTSGINVPERIREEQEKQITLGDLEGAMKRMNNNKTPGEDGIPVDFYKVFWTKIKECYYKAILQIYEDRKLHSTASKGVLNLIPKAGKDTRLIKNLRPITLLNTDYKIIEKAIADKMIPALETIIHTDQRGFMKNRRISVNIRKMLDIMHEADKQDLEAVVLSLDFVKCFDKCSFKILHGSLDFFKFGQIVKDWTGILYDNFTVKIQNNGHFSDSIPILKGVHQGGCCSSIYFLVIAEILAMSLRENQEIEGIMSKEIPSGNI